MKIAIDPGHNCPPDTGCAGLSPRWPTEDQLTKELAEKLTQRLQADGHTVIDCLPKLPVSTVNQSLRVRCNTANEAYVNLFISLHFNCFNKQAHGTEVFAVSVKGKLLARHIVDRISAACGFRNRGVKEGRHLFVLKNTSAVAVLVEVCFCDNESDMQKYNADLVANAIADAIKAYRIEVKQK